MNPRRLHRLTIFSMLGAGICFALEESRLDTSREENQKAKGKRQKSEENVSSLLPFAFCLLPFDFLRTLLSRRRRVTPRNHQEVIRLAIVMIRSPGRAVVGDLLTRFRQRVPGCAR